MINRRVTPTTRGGGVRTAQLTEHVWEFVPRINHHCKICWLRNLRTHSFVGVALRPRETLHRRLLARYSIGSRNSRKAQQMVKRTVLQHQDENVLNLIECHCLLQRSTHNLCFLTQFQYRAHQFANLPWLTRTTRPQAIYSSSNSRRHSNGPSHRHRRRLPSRPRPQSPQRLVRPTPGPPTPR